MSERTTTIEELDEALQASQGITPQEIVDAFIHARTEVAGLPLVQLTAGHELFLVRIKHPLSIGKDAAWGPQDVAAALFIFTRSSRELNRMVEDGTYEEAFFEFLDGLPMGEVGEAAASIIAHWCKARNTSLPMKAPEGMASSKKKADSAGGSNS